MDDHTRKLLKHGSRFHENHNNFLIAVTEYNLYCESYSQKIFPNLLDFFQGVQEKLLEEL